MGKLIVLEGPRGVGKTTFAASFERFGCKIFKASRGENPFTDMVDTLAWVSNLPAEEIVVADRFHLTELIMSLYFGRSSNIILMNEALAIHHKMKTKRWPTILLTAPDHILYRRVVARADGRGVEMLSEHSSLLWAMASKIANYTIDTTPLFTLGLIDNSVQYILDVVKTGGVL